MQRKYKSIQEFMDSCETPQQGVYVSKEGILCIIVHPNPKSTQLLNHMLFSARKHKNHGKTVRILTLQDVVEILTYDDYRFMDNLHEHYPTYKGEFPPSQGRKGQWGGYRSPLEMLGRSLVKPPLSP